MQKNSIPLPPKSLRFMNEDDEKFLIIAEKNAQLLSTFGLDKNSRLLDIGCGYGRLVYGLENVVGFKGTYLGMDILERHIKWCRENISPANDAYQFKHMDVFSNRYNRSGVIPADSWQLDTNDQFDFVSLFSVFTHMYEEEIHNYLHRIYEALAVGGRCLATFFLYDASRIERVSSPERKHRMAYRLNEHTLYCRPDDKLFAICFERGFMENMIRGAGFDIVQINYGIWAGGKTLYQDFIVMEKSVKSGAIPPV